MAQKSIYEFSAKKLLMSELPKYFPEYNYHGKLAVITPDTDWNKLVTDNPWLETDKLAAKPDQLFGKRGKANLLLLDTDFDGLKTFCSDRLNKEVEIGGIKGTLNRFLVEPFIPHDKEFYVSITSDMENDIIHFSFEGGIFVEENWDKVIHIPIPLGTDISSFDLASKLPDLGDLRSELVHFIKGIYQVYVDQDFAFLEINPFAVTGNKTIVPLDLKAKLDDTASFQHIETWGNPDNPIEFPRAFGQVLSKEEQFISDLDEKTGASLKFTILNRDARVWTMVAGGGGSVVYTDTIADMGFAQELGNYGEYSGNPNREHTELYAQTIIDVMTEKPDPQGRPKILLIGGGIANFTDVRATFMGIVAALRKSAEKLRKTNVKIYVRRGGPNEKEGLKLMKDVGEEIGVPIEVFDRYTHMTKIVPLSLKGDS
ncbi:MAG: ATP citrate lyase citrate-binding domain-containing protein [Candidatus Hodarchaeales archaeon]|jgi:succinyl-CoA synthetase beta subunit